MALFFDISFVAYLAALVLAVAALAFRRRIVEYLSLAGLGVGVLAQTAYIALRWAEAGRPPFSNMFESLILFAWATAAVYLVVRIRLNVPGLGAAVALMSVAAMSYAHMEFDSDIKPLVPALQNSYWLTIHVFTCFLGYAGFAISCGAAIRYLYITRAFNETPQEAIEATESVMSRTISFGFLFLTLGIISGSVWANSAWGSYWQWDDKETWSLITWIIYAIYLHCRYMRNMKDRGAAWIALIGFAAVLFTYFGVNFLLSGLHSYAK